MVYLALDASGPRVTAVLLLLDCTPGCFLFKVRTQATRTHVVRVRFFAVYANVFFRLTAEVLQSLPVSVLRLVRSSAIRELRVSHSLRPRGTGLFFSSAHAYGCGDSAVHGD